jgi:hypothetical protein
MPRNLNPKEIWLAPWCAACDRYDGERSWCADDAWGKCEECDQKPVKYVLAEEGTNGR